jgi:hypothetical protein
MRTAASCCVIASKPAALLHLWPESIELANRVQSFEAAGYRRPLLVFSLSSGDGDFHSMPIPVLTDLLTVIPLVLILRS